MSETAQPARPAAESEVVSSDPLESAAAAFKRSVEAVEEAGLDPGLRRDDEENVDAREGGDLASAGAEYGEAADDAEQAGQEPQPEPVAMPSSWSREDEPLWSSLPPDAQAKIAAREGQRDSAITRKFQEAAEVLRANQALLAEAQSSRGQYAAAVEQVLSLVVPQPPPRSMLDKESPDYDPDKYHLRKAEHEEKVALLEQHRAQLGHIRAQEQLAQFAAINNATREPFIASVPDIADQAKAPAIFRELIDYAGSLGAPPETFASPTTALEWHCLWKAREYDRLHAARTRVADAPKPEPRKPQPAVRPGVGTPRAAVEQQQRGAALERLRSERTVEAGAAALKHLMKGQLS